MDGFGSVQFLSNQLKFFAKIDFILAKIQGRLIEIICTLPSVLANIPIDAWRAEDRQSCTTVFA